MAAPVKRGLILNIQNAGSKLSDLKLFFLNLDKLAKLVNKFTRKIDPVHG